MKVDLATVVLNFGKGLAALEHILDRGVEYCREKDISEQEMLGWRLAPDMFPLKSQFQFVPNLACQWAGRSAGVDYPTDANGEMTVQELRQAMIRAREFLASLRPDQFADRDSIPLTVNLGQLEPTMPIGQWVAGFATTNFYFHLSTAYAILRSRGVQLGKSDLFAGGL
jgi:hypothetical protein